ncbi:MAG: zinc-binding dehydrogenase [Opitutales bacterium]
MKATAILVEAPQKVGLAEVEIPDPGPGEVLLRNQVSCISPGTELRCLAGLQDGVQELFPFIPGYASCGEICALGAGVTQWELGDVVCGRGTERASVNRSWGSHVSHLVVKADSLHRVPEGLPLDQAAVCRLAAIAYRGVCLANLLPHQPVAVIGLGAIGQLSARLHRACGNHVVGYDQNPQRVESLRQAGVPAHAPTGSLHEAVRETFPDGVDCVVDATGAAAVVPQAVECLRQPGWHEQPNPTPTYIVQGSYPEGVTFPYHPTFFREATVRFPRDALKIDQVTCLRLAAQGNLNLQGMVSKLVKPADASEAYHALQQRDCPHLTLAFDWA